MSSSSTPIPTPTRKLKRPLNKQLEAAAASKRPTTLHQDEENQEECVACYEAKPEIQSRNCNHMCLCVACYGKLTNKVCPLCRQAISPPAPAPPAPAPPAPHFPSLYCFCQTCRVRAHSSVTISINILHHGSDSFFASLPPSSSQVVDLTEEQEE